MTEAHILVPEDRVGVARGSEFDWAIRSSLIAYGKNRETCFTVLGPEFQVTDLRCVEILLSLASPSPSFYSGDGFCHEQREIPCSFHIRRASRFWPHQTLAAFSIFPPMAGRWSPGGTHLPQP